MKFPETHPYPTQAETTPDGLSMSWANEFGESITVALDTVKATSKDRHVLLQALTITHTDNLLEGVILLPAITRIGGHHPTIRDRKGKAYILQDNEANFIDHAVRVIFGYPAP
jgi:hypothetical protein